MTWNRGVQRHPPADLLGSHAGRCFTAEEVEQIAHEVRLIQVEEQGRISYVQVQGSLAERGLPAGYLDHAIDRMDRKRSATQGAALARGVKFRIGGRVTCFLLGALLGTGLAVGRSWRGSPAAPRAAVVPVEPALAFEVTADHYDKEELERHARLTATESHFFLGVHNSLLRPVGRLLVSITGVDDERGFEQTFVFETPPGGIGPYQSTTLTVPHGLRGRPRITSWYLLSARLEPEVRSAK